MRTKPERSHFKGKNEHDRIGIRVGQPKIGMAPDSLAPDQWLHRISVKLRLKVSLV